MFPVPTFSMVTLPRVDNKAAKPVRTVNAGAPGAQQAKEQVSWCGLSQLPQDPNCTRRVCTEPQSFCHAGSAPPTAPRSPVFTPPTCARPADSSETSCCVSFNHKRNLHCLPGATELSLCPASAHPSSLPSMLLGTEHHKPPGGVSLAPDPPPDLAPCYFTHVRARPGSRSPFQSQHHSAKPAEKTSPERSRGSLNLTRLANWY